MIALELKTFTIAGKQTDALLNEIGQVIGKNGVPQGGNIIRYRKDLGIALNKAFAGEMAAPLEAVDTLMIRSYESMLARQKTGLPVDKFSDFAREIGEINLKKIKGGKAIDYSKYLLTPQEQTILEQGIKSFKDMPGAMGKDGPLTRIIKCGVEGDCGNSIINGSFYEVQEALQIEKIAPGNVKRFNVKEKEIIEIFGKKKFESLPNSGKIEFDIMTKDTFIECKNIKWRNISNMELLSQTEAENVRIFIKKLKDHKLIAEGLNLKYELRSNQLIPQEWKNLLDGKNIKHFD